MIFILGGTKSGKTTFAQNLILKKEKKIEGRVCYLATAHRGDEEMKERIRRHKKSRPSRWTTHEETLNIPEFLTESGKNYSVILMDCLTLYLTNWLMTLGEDPDPVSSRDFLVSKTTELIHAGESQTSELIIISNQVENGLVSPYPLGRIFQDAAGISHQLLGNAAEKVFLMTAGIPHCLKG